MSKISKATKEEKNVKNQAEILTTYECVTVLHPTTQGKSTCTVCDQVSINPTGYIKQKSPIVPALLYIPCKSPRKKEFALKIASHLKTDD